MTDLSDFGAGVDPAKDEVAQSASSRSERARHRRRQYARGRCRGVATSKGCRCGAGIIREADGPFCAYHQHGDPVTIDDSPTELAQWCGQTQTFREELPEPVQAALDAVEGES